MKTRIPEIALVGLSAFQARRYPALPWAALAIPAAGGVVALVGAVAISVYGDSDREVIGAMTPWLVAGIGLVAMLAGSALFALATWLTPRQE
jgi:heme A synthase